MRSIHTLFGQLPPSSIANCLCKSGFKLVKMSLAAGRPHPRLAIIHLQDLLDAHGLDKPFYTTRPLWHRDTVRFKIKLFDRWVFTWVAYTVGACYAVGACYVNIIQWGFPMIIMLLVIVLQFGQGLSRNKNSWRDIGGIETEGRYLAEREKIFRRKRSG